MNFWINTLSETRTNTIREQGWFIGSGFESESIPMSECEFVHDFSDEENTVEEEIVGFLVSEFKETPPFDNPKFLVNHLGLVYPYKGQTNYGYPAYERLIVGEVDERGKIIFYASPVEMKEDEVAFN